MLPKLSQTWKWLSAILVVAALVAVGVYFFGEYHFHAAQAALGDDELKAAERHIDRCLRVWPRSPAAHLLAARISRYLGKLNDAEAHLGVCSSVQGGASDATQLEWLLLRAQSGEFEALEAGLWASVG